MYFIEEASLKHSVLILDEHGIAQRSEWEQLRRLERLQKAVRVARARLGMQVVLE